MTVDGLTGPRLVTHQRSQRIFFLAGIVILVAIACAGMIFLWVNIKPQPKPLQHMLFQGVEYIRDVRSSPRDIVIHVIKIDLKERGIRTLVTPGDPQADLPLEARTTSRFLDEFGLQVAVNGDGFTPWHSNSILDYYPHEGDPVAPTGFAASQGTLYAEGKGPTLFLAPNNQARIGSPVGKLHNAISGNLLLVKNGAPVPGLDSPLNPWTAVALDRANRYLILIVVDGRQPGYSQGVTLSELAEIIIFYGGYTAMNLDGGGSSTMVVEGPLGSPRVLNSPIHNQIPGRQRPVGNHLGIYAKPLSP